MIMPAHKDLPPIAEPVHDRHVQVVVYLAEQRDQYGGYVIAIQIEIPIHRAATVASTSTFPAIVSSILRRRVSPSFRSTDSSTRADRIAGLPDELPPSALGECFQPVIVHLIPPMHGAPEFVTRGNKIPKETEGSPANWCGTVASLPLAVLKY